MVFCVPVFQKSSIPVFRYASGQVSLSQTCALPFRNFNSMLEKNVSTVLKYQFLKFDLFNFENIVIFNLQCAHVDATEISIKILK